MSEYELLQAFRNERSEEAFAELVRRFAGLVYSVAKRRLANASLAEDIMQVVFIRLAKAPPNVFTHAGLAAWLHRTTLNVTIDAWRSENRRRAREQQALVMESATTEDAVWEDISPKLDDALNQLNDEDRQALLLRFFGQKTMRQIGESFRISEDAAKMRVSRAVDRLRTKLGVGAACTAAVFGTILAAHSVEAAPDQMLSRLAAMRLPVAAGVAGIGGLLGAFARISKFKLAASAAVVVVIGVGVAKLGRALTTPVSQEAVADPAASPSVDSIGVVNQRHFDVSGFKTFVPPPRKRAKMMFHVMDAETGGRLAGVKIHVAYFGAGGMEESHDLVTESLGVAAVPEPDDATKTRGINVFVVADGHVPKVVSFEGDGTPANYTMRLKPAMVAGGLVVNEQGLPVAGVRIMLQTPGNKPDQAENVDFQTCPVTNRDDGSWSCGYVPKDYTNEIRFILKKQAGRFERVFGPTGA